MAMTKPTDEQIAKLPSAPITPRLQAALESGGVAGLFPLLATWSRDELKALEADVDVWHQHCQSGLEEMHKNYAFDPQFFFSKSGQELLDSTVANARMEAEQVAAEILSVVYFYLGTDEPEAMTKARQG